MSGCNPYHTSVEALLKVSKQSTQPLVDTTANQSIIRSPRYLVNTHLDVAFVVRYVCCFSRGSVGGSTCNGEADSLLYGGYQQLGALVWPEEWKSDVVDRVQ
jgi:hypothetical protein